MIAGELIWPRYIKQRSRKGYPITMEYEKREILEFLFGGAGLQHQRSTTGTSGRGGPGCSSCPKHLKTQRDGRRGNRVGTGNQLITLPITLIIIKALIVRVGGETFAIPLSSVSESLIIEQKDIRTVERREVTRLRIQTLAPASARCLPLT